MIARPRPTRRSQPYRRSINRKPTGALSAITRGRDVFGRNPADIQRMVQRRLRKRRRISDRQARI